MGKHLTLEQRIAIQVGLERGQSINAIARGIGKTPRTVAHEIKHCERNHEYIRMVLPKGTDFDDLTQEDVDVMMSHINSYARPALGDSRPVDEFEKRFGGTDPPPARNTEGGGPEHRAPSRVAETRKNGRRPLAVHRKIRLCKGGAFTLAKRFRKTPSLGGALSAFRENRP